MKKPQTMSELIDLVLNILDEEEAREEINGKFFEDYDAEP